MEYLHDVGARVRTNVMPPYARHLERTGVIVRRWNRGKKNFRPWYDIDCGDPYRRSYAEVDLASVPNESVAEDK